MAECMAPWRLLLANSLRANAHLKHSSYFQLATVRPNGRPANRTIVFRGFIEGTDIIQFTTDIRSQKIDEIHSNPVGEICWYFTDSWEQFRIQGVLNTIKSSDMEPSKSSLREKAWFASSVNSRLQFMGHSPKLSLSKQHSGVDAQLDPQQGPVETFCLVTLDPEEVDYLHLKDNQRVLFKLTEKVGGKLGHWTQLETSS